MSGIIRCSHCRAYVNPYVVFIEGGRRWRCNFCETPNEVPNSYYNAVDQMGTRVDLDQHPELVYGACEFIATPDYIRRAPQPPVYTFVIDVSSASVANGMLYVRCFSTNYANFLPDRCRCNLQDFGPSPRYKRDDQDSFGHLRYFSSFISLPTFLKQPYNDGMCTRHLPLTCLGIERYKRT